VIDGYLKDHGLDRTRIVKAEIVVTDHGNKPAFDKAWASWMPDGKGRCDRSSNRSCGRRHDRDHHYGALLP